MLDKAPIARYTSLEDVRGPVVYLIHLDKPYSDQAGRKSSQHYVGYSEHLAGRIWHHRNGSGNPLLRAASRAGILFRVVRVWVLSASRQTERRFHDSHKLAWYCPECNERWYLHGKDEDLARRLQSEQESTPHE
jgi:hypothetical protein